MKWTEIIKGKMPETEAAPEPEAGLPFTWIEPKADFNVREFLNEKLDEIKPDTLTILTDPDTFAVALILAEQGDGMAADVSRHIFLVMGGNTTHEGGDGSADQLSSMVTQVMGGAGVVAAVRRLEEESQNQPVFGEVEVDFEEKEDLLNWLHKQRRRGISLNPDL